MAIGNAVPLKRYGKAIVAVAVLLVVLTSTVVVYSENHDGDPTNTYTYNDVTYELNDENLTATVTGLNTMSFSTSIIIANSITKDTKTYSVTAVADNAFASNNSKEELTIGSNVTVIGANSFKGCGSVTTLKYNATNVTSLGTDAFSGFGDSISGFKVTFDNNVTNIPANLFINNVGLNELIVGSSVNTIGANAFSGCTKLFDVKYNATNVTSLGANVFSGSGGNYGFTVTFGNNVTDIPANLFTGNAKLKTLTLGSGIISIGANAFSGCTDISGFTMSSSVETIGAHAFDGCKKIATLNLPNTLTSIGDYAFNGCTGIATFSMSTSVETIGAHAFDGCTGITNLNLPNTLTSIGDYAFNGCTGIATFSMSSSSIETIGAHAFDGCSGITAVFLPGTLTSIGDYAFGGCPSIKLFVFGEFGKTITVGEHVFSYNGSSNATVDYIFKNKGDATEYIFNQTAAKNGVFNNRVYECDEQGKATNDYLTIKFDANGGECDILFLLTDEDGKLAKLPTATRDGYTFDGWYLNGDKVTVDTVYTDNVTLKAQWTEIPGPEPEPEPEPKVEHSADGTPIAVIFVLVVIILGMMIFAPYGKE